MTDLPDRLVIDATVAVKWVVGEARADRAATLRGRRLFAPDLLVSECANVLWKKSVRGELTADEADMAARLLEASEVELVATRDLLATAVRIAIELNHPAYDCMYLAIAAALDLPLVTADERLLQAARGGTGRFGACVVSLKDVPARG